MGRAGSGKTTTLAAVADAYRRAGWAVVGVAPSARAARELEEQAGVLAFTVPRFHRHRAGRPLPARPLVIVDEAGMACTTDLTGILESVSAAGGKVVMVGDPRQLPEIGPGGGLTHAITLLGNQVCELTVNCRQQHQWEIDALEDLRHGDPTRAWHTYRTHGRVLVTDNVDEVHQRAVADWLRTHHDGKHSLLLAGTRAEADVLNRLARQQLAAAGASRRARRSKSTAGSSRSAIGCSAPATATDQVGADGTPTSVDNGTLATVTGIDHLTRQRSPSASSGQAERSNSIPSTSRRAISRTATP